MVILSDIAKKPTKPTYLYWKKTDPTYCMLTESRPHFVIRPGKSTQRISEHRQRIEVRGSNQDRRFRSFKFHVCREMDNTSILCKSKQLVEQS